MLLQMTKQLLPVSAHKSFLLLARMYEDETLIQSDTHSIPQPLLILNEAAISISE